MIDWNYETQYRCTACDTDYNTAAAATRCHAAPVVASVECNICGHSHQDSFIKNAVRAADDCCRPQLGGAS